MTTPSPALSQSIQLIMYNNIALHDLPYNESVETSWKKKKKLKQLKLEGKLEEKIQS